MNDGTKTQAALRSVDRAAVPSASDGSRATTLSVNAATMRASSSLSSARDLQAAVASWAMAAEGGVRIGNAALQAVFETMIS